VFSVAADVLPLSIIIATRNRPAILRRTLESLAGQSAQPSDLIIVDASEDDFTRVLCLDKPVQDLQSVIRWHAAAEPGAAVQRNSGIPQCSTPFVGFFDDDILFEPECVRRLWFALQRDDGLGGVNAMITNQRYQAPGPVSRFVFSAMAGRAESSYAGRVLGPAVNLLPEDRDDLPEVVPVEWLNTTCTLYRREALPDPPFPSHFTGYSLMEDLSLSLTVGKRWKLANARTARIFHDSQPGSHKSDPAVLAEMQLVNRHYVMNRILGRNRPSDYFKLILWMAFSDISMFAQGGVRALAARLRGECRAIVAILSGKALDKDKS
jgi:glycosyltransferase involved in cell wall biosynthesis